MRASVLVVAAISVTAAFVLHIAWWRIVRPKADIPTILAMFLVVPGIVYAALAVASALHWLAASGLSPLEWFAAYLLHASVSSAYIQTYPATQARSPSLSILIAIARSPNGLDREGIVGALDAFGLVGDRVMDLHRNALAKRDGDGFVLTTPGRFLARTFGAYRRFIGFRNLGG